MRDAYPFKNASSANVFVRGDVITPRARDAAGAFIAFMRCVRAACALRARTSAARGSPALLTLVALARDRAAAQLGVVPYAFKGKTKVSAPPVKLERMDASGTAAATATAAAATAGGHAPVKYESTMAKVFRPDGTVTTRVTVIIPLYLSGSGLPVAAPPPATSLPPPPPLAVLPGPPPPPRHTGKGQYSSDDVTVIRHQMAQATPLGVIAKMIKRTERGLRIKIGGDAIAALIRTPGAKALLDARLLSALPAATQTIIYESMLTIHGTSVSATTSHSCF